MVFKTENFIFKGYQGDSITFIITIQSGHIIFSASLKKRSESQEAIIKFVKAFAAFDMLNWLAFKLV